jgi:histone deacetylase 11
MVIDTDAHQGNGVARDKLHFKDSDLFILDAYNCRNYPMDEPAKAGIDVRVELAPGTKDERYLQQLQDGLKLAAASSFKPDLIIYNAGTDPYELDPLGRLGLSAEGIIERDMMVWKFAVSELRVPICMLLSGGYAKDRARIIADSIAALFDNLALLVRE